MKIEILYVAECPHYEVALANLTEVLETEGVRVEIEPVMVADMRMAEAVRFRGSPTIRIDGRDIEDESNEVRGFGLACRLYPGRAQAGVPPREMIRAAVRRSFESRKR